MNTPLTPPTFTPPETAAAFYVGPVMHARLKPVPHRFRYSVFSLLIDLDRLEEANRLSWFFSVERFNLLGFSPGSHGPEAVPRDPRRTIARMLEDAGLKTPVKRLFLLCYPRVFGFVFNPISVYFAYGPSDDLIGLVYEVRNTFGERHSYVAPLVPGELSEAGVRQQADKLFYVSPFLDQPMRYHFRVRPPGTCDVALRIFETDANGPILSATFTGIYTPVTDRSCLRLGLGMPLMTMKVVAGIHFEALRLWLKGLRFFSRPVPPPPASHKGIFLNPEASSPKTGET